MKAGLLLILCCVIALLAVGVYFDRHREPFRASYCPDAIWFDGKGACHWSIGGTLMMRHASTINISNNRDRAVYEAAGDPPVSLRIEGEEIVICVPHDFRFVPPEHVEPQ